MIKNFQFSIFNFQKNGGFTLFIAVIVTGTLLLIATGIVNLALKQAFSSTSARESQYAFYAADTGMECALYWDVRNPAGVSAFGTSTGSNITCNGSANLPVGGGDANATSTFSFTLTTPESYCVIVQVGKDYVDTNSNGTDDRLVTTIESKGYNTACGSTNPRRVERAISSRY